MAILIDSSVLIEQERGRLDLPGWMRLYSGERPFMSVITLVEMYHGLFQTGDPAVYERRRAYIQQCQVDFPLIPLDAAIPETAGRLRAEQFGKGLPIGPHDLLIAATAKFKNYALATCNVREFRLVEGLNVLHWKGDPSRSTATGGQMPT